MLKLEICTVTEWQRKKENRENRLLVLLTTDFVEAWRVSTQIPIYNMDKWKNLLITRELRKVLGYDTALWWHDLVWYVYDMSRPSDHIKKITCIIHIKRLDYSGTWYIHIHCTKFNVQFHCYKWRWLHSKWMLAFI